MSVTDRVTVSLPSDLRQAAQQVAIASGMPFSAVVNEALASWLRTRLVDVWLADHQRDLGTFDEAELVALAAEAGVPYLPPRPAAAAS